REIVPAVARPEQTFDHSIRSGSIPEAGKNAGAQRVITGHVQLRIQRRILLDGRIQMIDLGTDSKTGRMICSLRSGRIGQASPFDGARLIARHGLSLHGWDAFDVVSLPHADGAIPENATQFGSPANLIDQSQGTGFVTPLHQSRLRRYAERTANFNGI